MPGVAGLGQHLGMRREHLADGVVGPHRYFQHTSEIFKQMPEVAEVAREAALAQMRMIDGFIAGRRFIAGERYTIADITAMVALGLGAVVGLTVDSGLANLARWYGEVSARRA